MRIPRSASKLLMHAILLATSTVATQASDDADGNRERDDGVIDQQISYPRGLRHLGNSPPPNQYGEGPDHTKPADSSVIELVSVTEKRVTFNVKQSIIGDPNDCQASDKAPFFFMVFKNGQTMEDICPFYRDVDACFERTVHVPCDSYDNAATITVYVKAFYGGAIYEESRVANPYVGRCFPDHLYPRNPLMTSLSFTRTIQCGESRPKYCADVLAQYPSAEDGLYMLWPRPPAGHEAESREIYCHNMKGPGKPEEYIRLYPHHTYSTSLLPEGEIYPDGSRGSQTAFYKIRVDMDTLKVDVADYTFTRTYGDNFDHASQLHRPPSNVRVPFGSCQMAGADGWCLTTLWRTGFTLADPTDMSTYPYNPRAENVQGHSSLFEMMVPGNRTWTNLGPLLPEMLDTPKGTYNVQLTMAPITGWWL